MRLALGGLIVVLLMAGQLRADDEPRPWEKEVYYVVQIDNLADWNGYVFFVYPVADPDHKGSVLRVSPSGEVRYTLHPIPGQAPLRPSLYVLPLHMVPAPDQLPDQRDLRDMRPYILKSETALAVNAVERMPLTESNDTLVTHYRVERAGGDYLRLSMVTQQMVPRSSLPGEASLSLARWWPYGVGLVVLVVGMGAFVWWGRKRIVPR